MADPTPLRLIAEDEEDLQVISAAVQDAVTKAENLRYEARQRRFSIELNRFRWEAEGKEKARVRALLSVDGVLTARARGLGQADPDTVVSLLQIVFVPDDEPPGGQVILTFAGDGEIALKVEVLDVTLLDSDYVWHTRKTPSHERRKR